MFDLHTHHYRCGHAQGQLEDYVQEALRRGLRVIGLSDHAPLFAAQEDEAAPGMHMPKSSFSGYLQEAQALKTKYAGQIEVLVGIEADYLRGTEAAYREALAVAPLDYVLGSVHYFDGFHVYDPRRWQAQPDVNGVYRRYYGLVQEAVKTGLFDIVAHLDAVKGLGHQATEDLTDLIDETVAVIAAQGVAVEINSSGLRKCRETFPSPDIIRKLHAANVALTYGSDAHKPQELLHGWAEVRRDLEQLGVESLVIFRNRQAIALALDEVKDVWV